MYNTNWKCVIYHRSLLYESIKWNRILFFLKLTSSWPLTKIHLPLGRNSKLCPLDKLRIYLEACYYCNYLKSDELDVENCVLARSKTEKALDTLKIFKVVKCSLIHKLVLIFLNLNIHFFYLLKICVLYSFECTCKSLKV